MRAGKCAPGRGSLVGVGKRPRSRLRIGCGSRLSSRLCCVVVLAGVVRTPRLLMEIDAGKTVPAHNQRILVDHISLAGRWVHLLSISDLWTNSRKLMPGRLSRSIQAGSSSKSRERITTRWRCALMTSSCGRLTRSRCLDGRRFRRRWQLGRRGFTALRLSIVVFEDQTRLPT